MCRWLTGCLASFMGVAFCVCLSVSSTKADEPPKLRYGFQKDQKFAYDIVANIKCMTVEETWKGVLVFDIAKANDDQFDMKVSGRLAESIQSGSRFPYFPRHIGPPFGPHGPFRIQIPDAWTINRTGDVIILGRINQIPCLLGPEELLHIESLPKDPKAAWTVSSNTGITEIGSSPMPFPPRREETGHGAGEQIDYAITKTTPETVELTKKYRLSTTPSSGDETHFTMTGTGTLVFDRARGAFSSCSMKYDIEVNQNGTKLTVPVTLTYRLLTEAEYADFQKKAQEKAAAFAEANRPKPISSNERATLLGDLRSRNEARARAALQRLGKSIVDDDPAPVSAAIAPYLGHPDTWIQAEAAKAMTVWATPKAEAALIKASRSENWMARGPAIVALGRIPSPATAQAAAAGLSSPHSRQEAVKTLRTMGRVAEAATIPYANNGDLWVRRDACGILKEIGGRKSVAALQQMLSEPQCPDRKQLEETIAMIQVHVDQQGEAAEPSEPTPTKPETTPAEAAKPQASDGSRSWKDASGTFEVEAVFLGVADSKVMLKKKDGRTIRVPLKKLSAADQAWVKEHSQPPPENPFE